MFIYIDAHINVQHVSYMQRIINTSRDNQQMHIIPPTTPFFTIKYSKQVTCNVGYGTDISQYTSS